MLGLAVAVRVGVVGGLHRVADREERQQRGDEVGAAVERLRDEAEAAGHETGRELDREEECRREDRGERRSAKRRHGEG